MIECSQFITIQHIHCIRVGPTGGFLHRRRGTETNVNVVITHSNCAQGRELGGDYPSTDDTKHVGILLLFSPRFLPTSDSCLTG
jgi:hypothetical protein